MKPEILFDVFISYARGDGKTLASQLCQHLAQRNFKSWFDQNDIPPAVDWRNQISDGIEKAHNLLFIITPKSTQSKYCLEELETAYQLNKRIIPVLYIRVPREQRPEAIGKLNWIYFQEGIKKQFTNSQAPCLPTDIHCEFISESKKNANNLMSDIFLSYAAEDREIMEQVKRILLRQGLTVWTNKTDIKSGKKFQDEINNGIEGSDNLVYLLSNESVKSNYCQQELTYAASLNKRIIPLKLETVEPNLIPKELQGLQYINLPPSSELQLFQAQTAILLKTINQDAYYHQQHKELLVKAIKWNQQKQNPSILLRGHNLNHFSDWLDIAKKRHDYPPVSLQLDYVTASKEQPALPSLDVFISYSRSDSDFVRQLNEALQMQGKTTWFDQESIPSGSDFQQELYRGIQGCDNFLFVISPQSVDSPYCGDEVEFAQQQHKRIITLVYQPIEAKKLHQALAKVQWIDFNSHNGDFYTNFSELVRTLETDRDHVCQHTIWSLRAKEWADKGKTFDLLARGSEFALAEQWLMTAQQEQKIPPVTQLQQEFITASREAITAAAKREKQRIWILRGLLALVSSALVVASGLGFSAYREYRRATIRELQTLVAYSNALFVVGRHLDALVEAIRAKTLQLELGEIDAEAQKHIDSALRIAVLGIDELNRFWGHKGSVITVAFSPDGQLIASGATDNTIKLWDTKGKIKQTLKGHLGVVTKVVFSPDGQTLASVSEDGTLKLWDREGNVQITLEDNGDAIWDLSFSPDGQRIAAAGEDNTIKLWSREGQLQATLTGHSAPVWGVAFSPNGQTIASASADGTIKLWNADGTLRNTLTGHGDEVMSVTFSPDGQMLASGSKDNSIQLWDLKGNPLSRLQSHQDGVWRVAFSPDNQTLVSVSADNTIKLWDRDGLLLESFQGHGDDVYDVAFSPDGQTLVSASSDNTIRLWQPGKNFATFLRGHRKGVETIAFSPTLEQIASAGRGGVIRIWDLDGHLQTTLQGHQNRVTDVEFSPDGQRVASSSFDNTVKLWDLDKQETIVLKGHEKRVQSIEFSPNGQMLASSSSDNTIKLWNLNGTLRTTLIGHQGAVTTVGFSPDSKTLVSGGWDGQIKLWSTNWSKVETISGHDSAVNNVTFSPDGQTIASASDDKTVKLWNLDGTLKTTLTGHQDEVKVVQFSANGNFLVTAGTKLKLWTKEGTLLASVTMYAPVREVIFSPQGQSLAIAYLNRVIVLRDVEQLLDIDEVLTYGCDWIKDYLRTDPNLTESDRPSSHETRAF